MTEDSIPSPLEPQTPLAIESSLNGWRLRLRQVETAWEVRVVTSDRGGTVTLRRYSQPSLGAALQDFHARFMTLGLGDASTEWNAVRLAFITFRGGRPGIRAGRQPLRERLNGTVDRLMQARLIVADGLAAIQAKAREQAVLLPQGNVPCWLAPLLEDIASGRDAELRMQSQIDRITNTLLGKCPL